MNKNEILINTQIALFFDNILEKPEDVYQALNVELGSVFDGAPTILPIPKDPQLFEVPVVHMSSSNGVYSCNIARMRVDLFIAGEGEENFDAKKEIITNMSKKIFDYFNGKDIKIKRVGFVSRFFIEEEIQDEILENIFNKKFTDLHKEEIENKPSEFVESYIKYVQKINISNLWVNNFTTVEKFFANIPNVGQNIKGVLITRDFNTDLKISLWRDKTDFKISNFIDSVTTRFNLDKIKDLLWPNLE